MKVSRRRFLLAAAGAAAVILGYEVFKAIPEEKPHQAKKPASRRRPIVAMVKGGAPAVKKSIELIGGLKVDGRAVIKPNVGFPHGSAVTSPVVVAELARALYEAGASEVAVAESSVRGSDTRWCFEKTGYYSVLKPLGIEVIDLREQDDTVTVKAEGTLRLREASVYELPYRAGFLASVAKMKRHISADVTLGIKNLIGCFPDSEKGRFHRIGLHECIADIAYILKPNLVVIDATEAMTERGPTGGTMVPADTVIASRDPLAADYIAAKLLFQLEGVENPGERAAEVKHLRYAQQLGLGVMGSEVEVRFAQLP